MLKELIKLFSKNDNITVQSNNIINGNIVGGSISVNGKKVQSLENGCSYEIVIEGNVNKLNTTGKVTVNGNVTGNVNTTGEVKVSGDVGGNIDTTGAVTANNVKGKIDTIGNVTIKHNYGDINV